MEATDSSQKQEQEMLCVESRVKIKVIRNWGQSKEQRRLVI